MSKENKSFLFLIDFVGLYPNLRIFNYDNYKSTFSSFISIIIILFSASFSIYSFLEYLNQNPIVNYYKSFDNLVNKSFPLNNTFLMFKLLPYCSNNNIPQFNYNSFYITSYNSLNINIETCELGKNIDLKFKDLVENFEKSENSSINEFKCLNLNNINASFFQNDIDIYNKESYFRLIIYLLNDIDCQIGSYRLEIVSENDIINHNKKDNPIIPYYHYEKINNYDPYKLLSFNYYYQYIKYETDDGLFLPNQKNMNAISFSSISSNEDKDLILSQPNIWIHFRINKSNYDLYKRSYKRIQSFLADIMSIINLTIGIGKFISYYLLNKKMAIDIVEKLIRNNKIEENKFISLTKDNNKSNIFLENLEKDISEKNNVLSEPISLKNINKEESNINLGKKYLYSIKQINKIKKIGYLDIIKSYLCFKDNKIKLLNICNDFILKEFCIDRILKRLLKLEKFKNQVYDKNKTNHKIDEIYNCLTKINKDNHKKVNDIKLNNKSTEKSEVK